MSETVQHLFVPTNSDHSGAASGATDSIVVSDQSPTAEVVSFKLVRGVSEHSFLEASAAMQQFLQAAPGFVRRYLARGNDGVWLDYVEWRTLSSAKSAAEKAAQEPTLAPFMQSIEHESIEFRHLSIVQRLG